MTTSNPPMLHRRFRKEILKIPSQYYIYNYKFITMKPDIIDFLLTYGYEHNHNHENQLNELTFPITFNLNNTDVYINIKIKNMGSYPFGPPDILLKGKNIMTYYQSNIFIKYAKFLKPKKCCLVCTSLLNKKNWSCVASFASVFHEMLRNFIDIKRAIEMLHMEKIAFRYTTGDKYLKNYMLCFI